MRGTARRLLGLAPLFVFLAFVSQVVAQNIVVNSGFETWLDTLGVNMPFGWVTSAVTDSTSALRSTDAHSGSYSIKLVTNDTAGYMATAAAAIVNPGTAYVFSAFARSDDLIPPGAFIITWLRWMGSPVGTPAVIPVYQSSAYREYTRRITAPDSAFWCVVAFATDPLVHQSTAYVDDVTLTPSATGLKPGYGYTARRFQLYPAQPIPFSNTTAISYSLSVGAVARLKIYDLVGNETKTLVDDYRSAGVYTTLWNATDDSGESISPGIYFCRLDIGDQTLTQKLMLLGE